MSNTAEEAEMSGTKKVEFTLKVMLNKQKRKVIFAEVDSHLADVLLSFLTLPLGTIVKIMKKHYGDQDEEARVKIGSLTSLYNGLANLDSDLFSMYGCKEMLLNPTSMFGADCRKLKLDISDAQPTKYFICKKWLCSIPLNGEPRSISIHYDIARCICGNRLRKEIGLKEPSNEPACGFDDDDEGDGDVGVFTKNKASFLISDDLVMVPNVAVSVIESLTNLEVTDMDGAELRNVTFGVDQIMDLLKGSLVSEAPLSDIILGKQQMSRTTRAGILLHDMENEATSNPKKMILKLMVQKSTNKLLFAESGEDFVSFLFSFLSIPLGGVERLLGGKTCLKNIDNLYKSLENINEDKYLRIKDTKSRLTNPKLPHGYISQDLIFPLSEEIPPQLFYHCDGQHVEEWLSCSIEGSERARRARAEFTKGHGNYVKEGPTMYMVTDDVCAHWITRGYKHTKGISYIHFCSNKRSWDQSHIKEKT